MLGVAFAAVLLVGCSKSINTREAVQQGIIKDVRKRADVDAMDVNVASVAFRGSEADAVVSFSPKGSPVNSGLTMRYNLERQGDEWVVKSRSMADVRRHAGQAMPQTPGQLPAGHPGIDGQKP